MQRLYRYVKSHRWASNLGARVLSAAETVWAHIKGMARGIDRPTAPNWTTVLEDWASNDAVVTFEVPFKEHVQVNTPPRSIYEADPDMFAESLTQVVEPGFMATIADGFVWRDGAVILSDGSLLEESLLLPELHPLVQGIRLPKAARFDGSLGVLSTTYGRGFYHWVFDSLARLAIMDALDARPDAYVVNFRHLPFHSEWLQALGVDKDKVYSSLQLPFVRPKQALVTQIPGRYSAIPAYVAEFLHRKLADHGDRATSGPKRIYVSRKQAARRRLANESEVEELLGSLGFETVVLEDVPLIERSSLLRSAELFLCPDGAGLTNMLFCNENTKVIELFTHRRAELFGWNLSNRLGLEYYYLMGDAERIGRLPPQELADTIELALSDKP